MAYIDEESCFDCGSLNLGYKFISQDEDGKLYEVTCYDCDNSWDEVLEEDE